MGLNELHGRVANSDRVFVSQDTVVNPFVVNECAVRAVQVLDHVLSSVAINAGMAS